MEEEALKTELHDKIEHADSKQLNEIYGLLTNYFNGQEIDKDGWNSSLPEHQKLEILKGLEEAEAGLGTSFNEITNQLRGKYGLIG